MKQLITSRKFILLCIAVAFSCMSYVSAQTTMVNYDFNTGASYAALAPALATNVTCAITCTEAFATVGGTASGAGAFTSNATAGNAVTMNNSSGTNTRFWTFSLAGSALSSYSSYKVYLQSQRSGTGATTLTLAYSTNGSSYTNFGTTQAPGNGSFAECNFNLTSITAINAQSTVFFKIMASGASGTGTCRIDNFQVQGTVVVGPSFAFTANSLAFGSIVTATTSASQRDSISGANLTGAPDSITITAPSTDFQVSNNDTLWGPTARIPYASATLNKTPFYVRFTPQTSGLKTGNVTFSGGGVSSPPSVAVSGTGTSQYPTTASTNFVFSSITTTSMLVSFTKGNGGGRIVVARLGSPVSFTPVDGTPPSGVNSDFSSAADQGSGNKIVYSDTGASVTVTGLTSGETYYFAVYEYNGSGASTFYLTSPFLAGNATTIGPLYYAVTGSTYTQDFNGLPSTGTFTISGTSPYYLGSSPVSATNLNGWQFGQVGTARFVVSDGSGGSPTGATYSFGSTGNSDRALGSFASGSNVSYVGAIIKNTTPDVLTTVTISYAGEQWRRGDGSANTFFFSYAVGASDISTNSTTQVPALNFISPNTSAGSNNSGINGNAAGNRTVVAPPAFTLNVNWLPGQNLILRWDDINDGGNDDGISIDSLTFSAIGPVAPNAQDSSISFTNVSTFSMTASWLNGNGANRIVKINTSNSFTNPANGSVLTANAHYSGSGEQVVFNGPGSTVNVTGLTPGTNYFFRVYNYNGTDTVTRYNTATALDNPNSQSTVAPAPPTRLFVTSINGGIPPSQNNPFYLVIRTIDVNGYPQNVTANTNIAITLNTGSANLGGTLTGTFLSGTNTDTIYGLTYDLPELNVVLAANVTSGPALDSALTDPFEVTGTATQLAFTGVPASGQINTNIATFSVYALNDGAIIDPNYVDSITISITSGPVGGVISGTLRKAAVGGIATFNNIQFNLPGTYFIQADANGLVPAFSDGILITSPPALTELVVPKYMGGKSAATVHNQRTPVAVCLKVDNLLPNTSYDVRLGLAISSDTVTSYGAGVNWNASAVPPAYNSNTILNAFTTNGSGSSGPIWYYVGPTNNSNHFDPGQLQHLRMGVAPNGSTVNNPTMFGSKLIKTLDIATTARTASDTTDDGAFLKGTTSSCVYGKYILLYDNTAGTGDPMFSYQARGRADTNTTQSDLPTSINDIYLQTGTSTLGSWPAVIPTGGNNPNGVRRVESRNTDNTIFNSATDADGIWPGGANTTAIARHAVQTLTVSDAGMSTVTITNITSTPATCVGTNDGTATVTATGAGTLTYSWNTSPVQTTTTATGLKADSTYTVTVSGTSGCTASASVTIGHPASSTITANGPTTFCNGDSVVLSTGSGADHYSWSSNPSVDTLQSIVVKTSGSYTVTVTTGSCTQTSAPVVVTVNNFSTTGSIFSESMGIPSGTTLVNAYTGWQHNSAPFVFSSTTANQSDVRTSSPSTGYTGASGSGNVFLGTSVDTARNFIISGINTTGYSGLVLSFGLHRDNVTNGITVETSPDGTTFTPLTITQPPTANTWTLVTASGTVPATANLRIRFSKNNSTSFRIDDVKLSSVFTSVSVTPAGPITNCGPGSVVLTSTVPSGNLWSPGNQTTQAITVTTTGNYSVTVTDANGCKASSAPVSVRFVPAVTVSITSTTPAGCSGGSATATAANGTAPFSYSWNTSPVQNTATATGLAAGSYIVTVTDSNSCTATATATISQPAASTITASGPTTFCDGDSVTLSAGTGVSYTWSTGATTQSIVVKTSGSYTVTVDDGLGCTQTSSPVTVTVNNFSVTGTLFSENMGSSASGVFINSYTGWQNNSAPITFTSTTTPQSDVRNSNASTGYSGASGNGNVFMNNNTANPRDFIISGINTLGYSGTTLSFGLRRDSGTDSVTVETSTDGIIYTQVLKVPGATTWALFSAPGIPSTANLRVKFSKTNSSVFRIDDVKLSGTTGTVTVSASGSTTICGSGSVVLTSNVSSGNVWTPTSAVTQSITVSTTGTHFVTVTDANGCKSSSAPVSVRVVPAVTVAITSTTNATCNGFTDGSATALASGGTSPINYSWNSAPVQTTATATGLGAGSYIVTVTDSNSCSATATATITQPAAINVTATVSDSVICGGDSVVLSSTGTSSSFLTFASTSAVSIPDNNATGVTSSIPVSGLNITSLSSGVLANVKINSLTHTFDGNLIIRLIAPDGRYLTMVNRRGSGGDNFINTSFTPSATTTISSGAASFTGTFIPDTGVSASAAFSAFNGVNPNGTWQLFVSDNAASDTGSLNSWSISFLNPIVFSWTSTPSGFTSSVKSPGTILPSFQGSDSIIYHVTATNNTTGCSVSSDVTVYDSCATNSVTLNMNLFLQGYYSAPGSSTPMDYQGSGGCLFIDSQIDGFSASNNDVDSIFVSLIDSTVYATTGDIVAATVESSVGILQTDGSILNGVPFSGSVSGNRYYIKLTHRNHVETWSAETQLMSSSAFYDFTTDWSQAYEFSGNPFHGEFEVEPGKWGLYVGDINGDQFVDILDIPILTSQIDGAFPYGYQSGDLNGDGFIDILDIPILTANVDYNGGVYAQHP